MPLVAKLLPVMALALPFFGCEPNPLTSSSPGSEPGLVASSPGIYIQEFYYWPEAIRSSIDGRIAYDADPWPSSTTLHIYDLERGVADQPIRWPVGDFTGLQIPTSERASQQRGFSAGSYGSTSFQLYDTAFGFMIQSDYLRKSGLVWGGAHIAHGWTPLMVKPWARYGSQARVRLQYNVNINHFDQGDPECVAILPGALVIQTPDVTFQWVFFVWDNRKPDPHGSADPIQVDGVDGTSQIINVNTGYGSNTPYATSEPNSTSTMSGVSADNTPHWYAAYIDGSHLEQVIRDYNRKVTSEATGFKCRKLASTNLADYSLSYISAGPEIYFPHAGQKGFGVCHFGGYVQNMMLLAYLPYQPVPPPR